MAVTQTRYTFPVVNSKTVRLSFELRQKYGIYEYAEIATPFHGVQFLADSLNEVSIWRYTGLRRGRKSIANYNPNTGHWDRDISLDQQMTSHGWEKVHLYSGSDISIPSGQNGQLAYIDLNTTLAEFQIPGLYSDVWQLRIQPGFQRIGPVKQRFRLESRLFGMATRGLTQSWFDLVIWPGNWPYRNAAATAASSFPVAIEVSPRIENQRDPFVCQALISLLSSAWIEIVEVWQVKDELLDETLLPPVRVSGIDGTSFGVNADSQLYNFFFGRVNLQSISQAGEFRIKFRIHFETDPPFVNSLGYEDFWKTIHITRNADAPPDPVSGFQRCEENPVIHSICCAATGSGLATYDKDIKNLVPVGGGGLISHLHEPRVDVQPYARTEQPTFEDLFLIEGTSTAGTNFVLSTTPRLFFPPIVTADGLLLRPDEPLDGSGVQYDYSIFGTQVTVHGGWAQWLNVIFANQSSGDKTGPIVQYINLAQNGTPFPDSVEGPHWQIEIDELLMPNHVFKLVSADGVILEEDTDYNFGTSPNRLILYNNIPTSWVIATFSYGNNDENTSRIYTHLFTTAGPTFHLGRTPNWQFPPIVFEGGVHLRNNQDYTIVGNRLNLAQPATQPIRIFYS